MTAGLFSQREPRRTELPKASGRESPARRWLRVSGIANIIQGKAEGCQGRIAMRKGLMGMRKKLPCEVAKRVVVVVG